MTETHPRTNVTKMVAASQIILSSCQQEYPPRAVTVNTNRMEA